MNLASSVCLLLISISRISLLTPAWMGVFLAQNWCKLWSQLTFQLHEEMWLVCRFRLAPNGLCCIFLPENLCEIDRPAFLFPTRILAAADNTNTTVTMLLLRPRRHAVPPLGPTTSSPVAPSSSTASTPPCYSWARWQPSKQRLHGGPAPLNAQSPVGGAITKPTVLLRLLGLRAFSGDVGDADPAC
jgi:hypothetical protein